LAGDRANVVARRDGVCGLWPSNSPQGAAVFNRRAFRSPGNPFLTTDYTDHTDGAWIVM